MSKTYVVCYEEGVGNYRRMEFDNFKDAEAFLATVDSETDFEPYIYCA